jgi:hypothetical protein
MRARLAAGWLLVVLAGCGDAGTEAPAGQDGAAPLAPDGAPLADGATAGDAAPPFDATVPDAGAEAGPCPGDMAYVAFDAGAACIDLYEGAIVVPGDGGEVAWPWYEPVDALDAGAFRAVPAHGVFPQGYISEEQAGAACAASGKRLCTFDEWTAACRGRPAHDYVYPYGDTYVPGRCNEGKESPIVILFGPNPTYSEQELNDPRDDQLDGGLARGGDYDACVSTYGAFDMHGNIHEWIDDTPDPAQPTHGSFMGGYFVDAKINGPGCEYRTTAHEKSYHDYSTGFRCCADAR